MKLHIPLLLLRAVRAACAGLPMMACLMTLSEQVFADTTITISGSETWSDAKSYTNSIRVEGNTLWHITPDGAGSVQVDAGDLASEGGTGYILSLQSGAKLEQSGMLNLGLSTATDAALCGVHLNSATLVNHAGAKLTVDVAKGSAATGLELTGNSALHQAGTLRVDSIALAADGAAVYFYDASSVQLATPAAGELAVSAATGKASIHLGGAMGTNADGTLDAANPLKATASGSSTVSFGAGLSLSGGTLVLEENVTLAMGGATTQAAAVQTQWNEHSLTVDNGSVRQNVTLGEDLAGSWDKAITIASATESGYQLTQKENSGIIELTKGHLSNSTLRSEKISITGSAASPVVLNTVTLDVTRAGGELTLSSVTVKGSSLTSSSQAYSAVLNHVTFVVDADNSALTPSATSELLAENISSAVLLEYGALSRAAISGNMTMDVTGWAEELRSNGCDGVVLRLGEEADLQVNPADVYASLYDGVLVSASAAAGRDAVFYVGNGRGGYKNGQGDIIIGGGIVTRPLDDDFRVELEDGGTVDVSQLPDDLPQEYISGTGGELITAEGQKLQLDGTQDIGYDLPGRDGQAAADLIIGKQDGERADADITLSGERYDSGNVELLSGELTLSPTTTLGTAATHTSIGSGFGTADYPRAILENQGTLNGTVDVLKDGLLHNDGTVTGPVTVMSGGGLTGNGNYGGPVVVQTGALHDVGCNGLPSANQFSSGLTYENGARLHLYVDGTEAANGLKAAPGTHSFVHVSGAPLSIQGEVATTVTVSSGILAAGSRPFALTMLRADGKPVNTSGLENPFTLTLNDPDGLLLPGSGELVWVEDDNQGTLTFTGSLNTAAAVELLGRDGHAVANTLWSSTSALRSFARVCESQHTAPAARKCEFSEWGALLGDFVSMNGFSSHMFGGAIGADRMLCNYNTRLGIAFGHMVGNHSSADGRLDADQEANMVGLYGEYVHKYYNKYYVRYSAYASYGRVENEADMRVGGARELAHPISWDEDVFALGGRAETYVALRGQASLTPFIGLEYLHGSQAGFMERVGEMQRVWHGGSMQQWRVPVGATLSTRMPLRRGQLLPALTLAYVGDIACMNPRNQSTVYGETRRHTGSVPGRHALQLNLNARWLINQDWSVEGSYTAERRSGEQSQEFSAAVRYTF